MRNASSFALLFIDLDKFKAINDTRGHVFGDRVLIETASRLRQSIRQSDTAARIGGDEFLILLENISNKEDATIKVDALTEALSEKFIIDRETFAVSFNLGIAIYPDDGTTTDALLKFADNAMYGVKHSKRHNR